MNLEPCDVLLYVIEGKDIFSAISRWGEGRFGHAALYLDNFFNVPMIYQSTGRGAALDSLQQDTGRLVLVMRPDSLRANRDSLIRQAITIASDPRSYYDYHCIARSCIPRLLKQKFTWLPIPTQYHRDAAMICSEAVAEVFWRAGIDVLPKDIVPLPGDFAKSPILYPVCEGRLFDDIVPPKGGFS